MIFGRSNDDILVSGVHVYPTDVEDVLAAHPGLFAVAAVGVRGCGHRDLGRRTRHNRDGVRTHDRRA
ncbi:hypothetical protein CF640_37065 [Burkholderia pseudomallei]|nr:hypothetical protein CF640_37065 [Burkholderia pseudomallei]